jgi:putative (di)nucleoside polyphosphate hydrolase
MTISRFSFDMSTDYKKLLYRPGVGIMLLNKEKSKIFVGKRINNTDRTTLEAWQMPQGGIDRNEDDRTAALRELKEEVGTDDVDVLYKMKRRLCYDIPEIFIPKLWGGLYRGQRQVWYLMRLNGGDELINISTDNPEFIEWKWVNVDQLIDLIVEFKRPLYADIVKEFLPIIGGSA